MKNWTVMVSDEEIRAARSRRSLRRADRYTVMAVAGLLRCDGLAEAELAGGGTALITYSVLGPHATVFATLDDILDYPEDLILPTKFSHSVVNAAASYIGTELGITGATFALVGFEDVRAEALSLAKVLLKSGVCTRVLAVGIEERGLLPDTLGKMLPERFGAGTGDMVEVALLDGSDAEERRR